MVTSVVSRVISDAEENLSILAKEKVWILRNIAARRLRAKPADARAPYLPPMIPAYSPTPAATSIASPTRKIRSMRPASTPSSMIFAIKSGITISIATSSSMKRGVIIESRLNSLISWASLPIMG